MTSKTAGEEVVTPKLERIRGTVKNFITFRGFGFLSPDDEPDVEVFVYLSNLVGYEGNEYPLIPKGTPVEFVKVKDAKGWRAQEVSQPGGAKLVSVAEDPSKNYNRALLYTGTVRFFNQRQGYGFITCDVDKIEWGGKISDTIQIKETKEGSDEAEERSAANIWFQAEEIVGAKDIKKALSVGDKVQFNVYIDERGLGAGKVLLTLKSKRKRRGDGVVTQQRKKPKTPKLMAENTTYLKGNFRGALQEYFQQRESSIQTTYETEKDPKKEQVFLSTARTIGYKDDLVEGCGHGGSKKAAVQFAALDLMFKLDLITKEQHMKLHKLDSI